MSKTSSKVKDRYNKKVYDQIIVRLPKGMKEQLKELCIKNGDSMNSVFVKAVTDYLKTAE